MKKIIAIAAVSSLALFGCAANTAAPTQTVTMTQAAPTVESKSDDERYIDLVKSQNNYYVNNMSDYDLLNLGGQICPILDSGTSVKGLIEALATGLFNDGIDDPEAFEAVGVIVGAAIVTYCPQYNAQAQSL